MIRADNVVKVVPTTEGNLTILNDISLSLSSGQSLAITGPSGSGKSTLLGILAGLDMPTSGAVELNGKLITEMDEEERASIRSQYVGFVFQSFHLLPGLTALENVMLPLELNSHKAGSAKEIKAIALEFLSRVGLDKRLRHYPKQLSGGEQQRVAIARAFACMPKILFADEPTGNLDTHTGERVIDLLFSLNKEQETTLVLVTHEKRLADLCKQNILLDAGCIISNS